MKARSAATSPASAAWPRCCGCSLGESTREVLAEILPDAEASGELDKLEESGVVSQLRLGEPKL